MNAYTNVSFAGCLSYLLAVLGLSRTSAVVSGCVPIVECPLLCVCVAGAAAIEVSDRSESKGWKPFCRSTA